MELVGSSRFDDETEMGGALRTAMAEREVETAVRRLPPLPSALQGLLTELDDVHADIGHLEERIGRDPALTTRLLKMANSSLYAPRVRVCSVSRAILVLGLLTARNVVIASGLRSVFGSRFQVPGYTPRGFLERTVSAAAAANRLGRHLPQLAPHGDLLFVAGLLHDIGVLVLGNVPRESPVRPDDPSWTLESERESFGMDHQTVAERVVTHWCLPPELMHPLTHHHDPVERLRGEPVTLAIALVDAWLSTRGVGRRQPLDESERAERLAECLRVSMRTVDAALVGLEKEAGALLEVAS